MDYKNCIAETIEFLRDEILIHSYLYYELDTNVISDYEYDMMCKDLAKLQACFPEVAEYCAWHEYFHDFDGSTGYHLPKDLPYIIHKAQERLNEDE